MARDLAHESNSAGTECDDEPKTDGGDAERAEYDAENTSKGLLNRRNYLRLGAAAAATVAGTGAVNTAAAAAGDHGMSFDRTVDAVDDLGWDPNGNEPVTDSLRENLRGGTLIELPPGEYLVDGTVSESELQNWGIRGTGGDKGDARFVVPQGSATRIFNIRGDSRNVLIENLTFHQYDTWETSIGNALQVADNLVVKDVEVTGKNPSQNTGSTSTMNVYVFDPDGKALIDGFVVKGATELAEYPNNTMTLYSGAESKGTITVRNSHFENCGSHGIYASRCEGSVRIENCFFRNNQNTHARISGEGSWAKNSKFVWDIDASPNSGTFQSTTGLTFESGFQGLTGGLVENCEFICEKSATNSGCLKVDGSHGGITVRDCLFEVDADGSEPFWADAAGDSHMIDGTPEKPWDITLENVHIHGSSKSTHGNTGGLEIQGRDDSTIKGCCIDMSGDRDGVYFANLTGDVSDSNIHVPGEAVALENADAQTSNITHTACNGVDGETGGSSDDGTSDDGSTDDGSSGSEPAYANDLTVFAEADAEAFEYEVVVDGDAELMLEGENAAVAAANNGGVGESIVENDDGTVSLLGIVAAGGGDSFTFDGEIVDFQAGGPARVVKNGEEVDLGALTKADTVRVFAKPGAEAFVYEFDVAGDAELILEGENAAVAADNGGVGESIVENDDGTVTVRGIVANGGGDSFRTSGEITAFRTEGSPVVYRNGERFDWQKLGLPRTLTIEGSDKVASYAVTVSGDIAPNPAKGSMNAGDSINGSTTEGAVMGGVDAYLFSGSVADIRLKGDATILVDGEVVDPEHEGLDHQLEVVGTGATANYGLTVSGELAANSDGGLSTDDVIDGNTATGSVTDEADRFLFSGNITAFELQGSAAVYLDGQQVDPALLTSETDPVLANTLVVRGSGAKAGYSFDVSGSVQKAPDLAATEAGDTVAATEDAESVSGTVVDDGDGYRFSGDLTSMMIEGSASIRFADLDG